MIGCIHALNERLELEFVLHGHVTQVEIETLRHNLLAHRTHVNLPVFVRLVLAEVVDEVLIGLEHRVDLYLASGAARHKAVEIVPLE